MDIVSRLKTFMNSLSMTSTQFADACRIPRPSMSQLLNGRNKKVSDEIVTKIHEAFPQLSVLWLMFGEGDMESTPNIQFSEPQNALNSDIPARQSTDFQTSSDANRSNISNNNFNSEKSGQSFDGLFAENFAQTAPASTTGQRKPIQPASTQAASIKIDAPSNKRITNIVVFYDDNSFESFNPAANQ